MAVPVKPMAEAGAFLGEFQDKEKEKLAQLQFAGIVGRFYEDLALRLLEGADAGFKLAGVPIANVTHHSVPGAYELPFAANAFIDGVRRKNARDGGGQEVGARSPVLADGQRDWTLALPEPADRLLTAEVQQFGPAPKINEQTGEVEFPVRASWVLNSVG